jgi:hypothetical protein
MDMREKGPYLEVFLHALKVEANRLLVEVAVAADLKARIAEDGGVVAPGWDGKVDDLGVGIVASEESTANTESTSTGDGLSNSNLTNRKGQ